MTNLYFKKLGEKGKNIIIIHGLYGSSDNWMTAARKLSENYQVYCIDQRNHGKSPHHPSHDYESMKDDLATFFKQHELDKAIIIGHSMGGKVAMLFASCYPHLVEKLVVVDICPKDYSSLGEYSQIHEHKLILETLLELQHRRHSFLARKDVTNFLELKLRNKELTQFLSKSITWDRENNSFELLLNADVLYANLGEIINGVNERHLQAKSCQHVPALFIRGLKSPYISNDDLSLIKKIFPLAHIADIPNAGHWLHVEQAQLFMETLSKFLN
ncbi:MAG: alpha/beta fold hydrolase [Mangrovibacterium sp.]